MKQRFEGDGGRKLLIETLQEQKIVGGNVALAREIAATGELVDVKAGDIIIQQGGDDNNVYLILSGSLDILVNGRRVAKRLPNDHVGEMAAIQPTQRRSGTVIADEDSVLCKLSAAQLSDIGDKYPQVWKSFAKELARRLQQRNVHIAATHDKIRVFIIASVEALEIARAIQNAFERDPFTVVVWTDGVFRVSHYAIEALERKVDESDFAIAIAQPDDTTQSRGQSQGSPRDNVIFELGFFMGRLGRHRAFLVEPRGEEIRLPSDLSGITTVTYKAWEFSDLPAALAPACNHIRQIIRELGPNN